MKSSMPTCEAFLPLRSCDAEPYPSAFSCRCLVHWSNASYTLQWGREKGSWDLSRREGGRRFSLGIITAPQPRPHSVKDPRHLRPSLPLVPGTLLLLLRSLPGVNRRVTGLRRVLRSRRTLRARHDGGGGGGGGAISVVSEGLDLSEVEDSTHVVVVVVERRSL